MSASTARAGRTRARRILNARRIRVSCFRSRNPWSRTVTFLRRGRMTSFARREERLKRMENNQDNTYSVLVDKGAVVEASYSPPELPKFGGNPLIEALPLTNTRKQAAKLMQRSPDYDDEMRLLPLHLRAHAA